MKKGILGLLISGLLSLSYGGECAYYTVKRGDSYEKIAKRFGLDTKTLMEANRDKKTLREGDKVCIPSKSSATGKSARSEGSYSYYTVKKGGKLSDVAKVTGVRLSELERLNPELKGKVLQAGTKVKVPQGVLSQKRDKEETYQIYTVQKSGARLEHVAKRLGVELKELERLNPDLKGKTLEAGTKVKVPVREAKAREEKLSEKESYSYYTVKRGGRLSDVAKATGVRLSELERLNPELKGKFLKAGTKVKVPVSEAKAEKTKPTYKVHRVRKGETLSSIAKAYGVSPEEIKRLNNLKSSRLHAGQRIRIPVAVAEDEVRQGIKAQEDGSERVAKREEVRVLPPAEEDKIPQVSLSRHSLPMPVEGKVVQSLRGVDIITDCGNPVKSVADGRVIYSGGDLQAYGNMVIVEHDGFMSLYAFNEQNLVRRGDRVSKGQAIAKVGRKTGEEQCMLRFELRSKDGAPLNPMDYLAGVE